MPSKFLVSLKIWHFWYIEHECYKFFKKLKYRKLKWKLKISPFHFMPDKWHFKLVSQCADNYLRDFQMWWHHVSLHIVCWWHHSSTRPKSPENVTLAPVFVKHNAPNICLPLNMTKFIMCQNSTNCFGICSKVNQIIYSSSLISWPSF